MTSGLTGEGELRKPAAGNEGSGACPRNVIMWAELR